MIYRNLIFFIVCGIVIFLFKIAMTTGAPDWMRMLVNSGIESLAATVIFAVLTGRTNECTSSRSAT